MCYIHVTPPQKGSQRCNLGIFSEERFVEWMEKRLRHHICPGTCSTFGFCCTKCKTQFTAINPNLCTEAGKIKRASLHLLSSHSLAIKGNFFLNSSEHRNQLKVWAVQLPRYGMQRSRFCSIYKTTQTLGGCRRSK